MRNRFAIASDSDSGSSTLGSTKRIGGYQNIALIKHNHDVTGVGLHDHIHKTWNKNLGTLSGNASNGGSHVHNGEVGSANINHKHGDGNYSTDREGAHDHPYTTFNTGTDHEGEGNNIPLARGNSESTETGAGGGHSHNVQGESAPGGGSHEHPFSMTPHSGHGHPVSVDGGIHQHDIKIYDQGPHSHETVEEGQSTGTNRNIPPFFAIHYIMRIL